MSKYTTEVRYICEHLAGFDGSTGADSVDVILERSWDKIFSNFPIFDEAYRPVLCKRILKHFYLREIGAETVGIWKLWLNERMDIMMNKYNRMYEADLIKFNPLYDVDYERTGKRVSNGAENFNNVNNGNSQQSVNSQTNSNGKTTSMNLYSETPQGGVVGLESGTYLTDARKTTDDSNDYAKVTSNTTNVGTEQQRGTKDISNLDDYTERVFGKQGGGSMAKVLQEFRNSMVNIDELVCNELEDLFFGLW